MSGSRFGFGVLESLLLQVECKRAPAAEIRVMDEGSQWCKQIISWRDELGLSRQRKPFDMLNVSICGLEMTPRIRAILNLVVASKIAGKHCVTKAAILVAISTTIVDVSQNPCRRAFTPKSGVNHTLCTSSRLVHLGLMRVLLPVEAMLMQGHNIHNLKFPGVGQGALSNHQIRCLAGEGMFLPSLGMLIWALLMTGAFLTETDRDDEWEVVP